VVVRFVIPDPSQIDAARLPAGRRCRSAGCCWIKQLLRLNYGIFALHAVLMALFVGRAIFVARADCLRAATG